MDPQTTLDVLKKFLLPAYPERELGEATLEMYLRCLSDLPVAAVFGAVLAHVGTSKWFPMVAELRQLAAEELLGGRIPCVVEAYAEVLARIDDTGSYGVPNWSHPAIAKTVQAMGWRNICFSEEPDVCRSNFIRLYEIYTERMRRERMELPEVGRLSERLAQGSEPPLIDRIRRLATFKRVNG